MNTLPAPPNLSTWTPSPELWSLLATGPKENAEVIRRTPALRAQAEASQRQLEILCEPAGDQVVMGALAPLVLVFGIGEQAKSQAFWGVYREVLADLPRIALDRAVKEYERVGKFFPKPAEIRELALPHAETFRQAAYRAAKAQEQAPEPMPAAERMPREKFDALMAEFASIMADKDPFLKIKAKAARPTPSAKVDERGVSDEMRALLARQYQHHGA